MSDHDTYVMRAVRGGWVLLLNGEAVGTFGSRAETEQAAFAGLEVSRGSNKAAELLCQEAEGGIALISKVSAGFTREVAWSTCPAAAD